MVISVNGWVRHQLIEHLDGQEVDDGGLPHAGRHLLHVGTEASQLHRRQLAVLLGPGGGEVVVGGGEPAGAALEDGAPEQAPGQGRHQVIGRGEAPGRLPIDGDQVWVPAKLPDVLLDPSKGHHLVPDPGIAGNILSPQGEKSKQTQTISVK